MSRTRSDGEVKVRLGLYRPAMTSPPEISRLTKVMPAEILALALAGRAPRLCTLHLTARTLQAAPELQPRLLGHITDGPSELARLMGLDEPLAWALWGLWYGIQHEPVSARIAQLDRQLHVDVFLTSGYGHLREEYEREHGLI
ncbi:hypothetical protein GCM10010840_08720 [Deinococcus aerolatus]|uniref:Uncharacterized protein n=2 Tax=Deinococcus aerolatus TaxID=522487 RepID=A0ABQ2G311_9DEIO|nr:hypothetical protein GCM10010840_08720 [Deinococcus aerolatus]